MVNKSYPANIHLAVVESTETELFHGAVYHNHPAPSGSDRWLLSVTMNEGFRSLRKATIAINAAFPDIQPLDLPAISDDDSCCMNVSLPVGALLTCLTPNRKRMGDSEPHIVEMREFDSVHAPLLDIPITLHQLRYLVRTKQVKHDSSSGDDPELNYRYDHYLVMPMIDDSTLAG